MGLQRKSDLEAFYDVIHGAQKTLLNFYEDKTTKYALTPISRMPAPEFWKFDAMMGQLMDPERQPPALLLDAIRMRLVEAGSELTDPMEFLKLMNSNFRKIIDERNRLVHEHDMEHVMNVYHLFGHVPEEDRQKKWSHVTKFAYYGLSSPSVSAHAKGIAN